MAKLQQFVQDRRVHLVLVTLGFIALAVADVMVHAYETHVITLPASIGLLVGPYVPILGYMIASWRKELGQQGTLQQMAADAATQAAQNALQAATPAPAATVAPPMVRPETPVGPA